MAIVRGPSTEDFWHIQFGDELAPGESLTGTPVVTGHPDLSFEDVTIEDEQDGPGQSVVRVRILGAKHGRAYPIKAVSDTSTLYRKVVGQFTYLCFEGA